MSVRRLHAPEVAAADRRRSAANAPTPVRPTAAAALLALQRTAGNRAVQALLRSGDVVQTQRRPSRPSAPSSAGGTFSPARTAAAYIDLVREAERRLTASGMSSVDQHVQILSGIYYGTDWSLDFDTEHSAARNLAFQIYTSRSGPGADPRTALGPSLFAALKGSQDVAHPRLGKVDVGHLIIGLNARQSWPSRTVPVPTQGATGLEITTWVGDLGGATGQLARRRATAPATPAATYFTGTRGTDYGADSNLEGDVAAYVVGAAPRATGPGAMAVPPGGGVADALATYFVAAGATSDRATKFLEMVGGTFTGTTLSNRAAVEASMATKFRDFGRWYMGTRYGPAVLPTISPTLAAAAGDVAVEFVNWLLRRIPGGASPSSTGRGGVPATPDLIDRAWDLARSWGL